MSAIQTIERIAERIDEERRREVYEVLSQHSEFDDFIRILSDIRSDNHLLAESDAMRGDDTRFLLGRSSAITDLLNDIAVLLKAK